MFYLENKFEEFNDSVRSASIDFLISDVMYILVSRSSKFIFWAWFNNKVESIASPNVIRRF